MPMDEDGYLIWPAFKATVEGSTSAMSCFIEDGQLGMSAKPVSKGDGPKPGLLADFLRTPQPIPQVMREWLADMFDPDALSEYQARVGQRKRHGKRGGSSQNLELGMFADRLFEKGSTYKQAIWEASQRFGVSEGTAEAALRYYREAYEANRRANLD